MIRKLEQKALADAIPTAWLYPLYRIFLSALRRSAPWWARETTAFQGAIQATGALEEPLLVYLSHLEEPDPPPQEHRDAEREQRLFDQGRERIADKRSRHGC